MDGGTPRPTGLWRSGRFTPGQVDTAAAATVAALASMGAVVAAVAKPSPLVIALVAVSVPLAAVPLLWRRTHPGPVLLLMAVAFTLAAMAGAQLSGGFGVVWGSYAVALYGERRLRVAAGVSAAVVLALAFLGTAGAPPRGEFHLGTVALGYGVAWVVGDRTRTRRAYVAQLEERARWLERERQDQTRQAADRERTRIARELHDVVAHQVSVIALQAAGGRAAADADPARARDALLVVERTARATMAELRTLLGVLRRGDRVEGRHPQPGLADVDALVEAARAAGCPVVLRRDGPLDGLPAMVDLSAYRVVQEALTNVLRHAPGSAVHVLVRRTPGALRIIVVDGGPGPRGTGPPGHGLVGMRERVELAGGELQVGPGLGGGFRVEAHLPLPAALVDEPGRAAGVASASPRRPGRA